MAALISGADGILSAMTHKWVSSRWQPLFANMDPLFTKLFAQKGQVLEGWGQGLRYPVEVPASGPSTVTVANSASAYAALTFTDTDFSRVAEYTPHELIRPVSMQTYQYEQCKGAVAKLNYLEGILKSNMKAVKQGIRTQLWATEQTSNSGGYVAPGTTSARPPFGSIRTYLNAGTAATVTDSLTPAELTEQLGNRAVASATGATPVTTVGNISRVTDGAGRWCTPIINGTAAVTLTTIAGIYRTAADEDESPDLGITTKDVFAKLEAVALLNGSAWPGFQRGNSAQFGWDTIRYMNMDIVYSDQCPGSCYLNAATTAYDDNFFAINTKHIFLWRDSADPAVEMVPSDGRPIKKWVIRHVLQLCSDNLGRVHARHVNLQPAA